MAFDADKRNGFFTNPGDRRQELMFIGKKLDESAIRAGLHATLLTDDEMNGGPEVWSKFRDPLPEWPILGPDAPHHHAGREG